MFSSLPWLCVCGCVPFWQYLLSTSHACPLSTPVLSPNIVIHHGVVHWSCSIQPHNPPLSSSPTPFKLACLIHFHPSFPPPVTFYHPLNPTHLRSISSAVPPSLPNLPPLSLLQVFIAACPPMIQTVRREMECSLSPRASDPCQGDKLPTAACLHSWKMKDLWGARRFSMSKCVGVCDGECEKYL